jgi:multiple sugar transport system permease protein
MVNLKRKLRGKGALLLTMPSVVLILLIAIYPILFAFATSLTNRRLNSPNYDFVFLSNYISMFSSRSFWHALWVTLVYTIVAVGVEMLLGFAIALFLNQPIKGRFVFRLIMLIPLMLPPATGAMMWKALLDPSTGVINYGLRLIGIEGPAWLGSVQTAIFSVAAVDIYHFTPFVALILLAGLQSVPRLQYEVAEVDGASSFQTFKMVTLPQIVPAFYLVLLFRLALSLTSFDIISVATGGGPGDATTTLNLQAWITGYNWNLFGASAAICIFLWFMILLISQKLFGKTQRSWGKEAT